MRRSPARAGDLNVPRLPGELEIDFLENGLTLCLLRNPKAPVVTTALFYRVGARAEPPGQGGVAHFLEHMMFKGSPAYGPGEVDRITQLLGGSNNAFTTHDTTAYYFKFASDRWSEGLKIEADRMAELSLDPPHVASERQVILEEIAMYENDPWASLEFDVQATLFPDHPYGQSVLGPREELSRLDGTELREFHHRFYCPKNAVLVLAGDVGDGARQKVEEAFGALPPGQLAMPEPLPATPPSTLERVERYKGEVSRLLLSLPGPAASHPDHPVLGLLLTLLAGGKASRFHRTLVEEEQLCVWISTHLSDNVEPGAVTLTLELVAGVEPQRMEERLLQALADLPQSPPTSQEIERAKQIVLADWVFGHERVYEQALAVGFAVALFDPQYTERYLRHSLAAQKDDLLRVAELYLRPDRGGVVGWSYRGGGE